MDHSQLEAEALPVMRDVGELFGIHNDFSDVFGNNQNDGKVGNDITQGKCTWLVVTALEKAQSSAEKQIIKAITIYWPTCNSVEYRYLPP